MVSRGAAAPLDYRIVEDTPDKRPGLRLVRVEFRPTVDDAGILGRGGVHSNEFWTNYSPIGRRLVRDNGQIVARDGTRINPTFDRFTPLIEDVNNPWLRETYTRDPIAELAEKIALYWELKLEAASRGIFWARDHKSTLALQVGAGADDGYWNATLNATNSTTYLDTTPTHSWFRFTGVTALAAATVSDWRLSLYGAEGNDVTVNSLLHMELATGPAAPTTSADANGRSLSTGTAWNAMALTIGSFTQSPSFHSDANAWIAVGSPTAALVMLKHAANNYYGARTYEENTAHAAKLDGTYTTGTTFTANLAGSITPAGGLTKQPQKFWAGGITPSGAIANAAAKAAAGSVTPTGAASKAVSKALDGSSTPSGALTLVKVVLMALGGSITATGDLAKSVAKSVGGSMTPSGAIANASAKALSGSVTAVGALANAAAKALAGTSTASGALARLVDKGLAGSLTPSGSIAKDVSKALAGSVTPAGALAKLVAKALSGSLTAVGALTLVAGAVVLVTRLLARLLGLDEPVKRTSGLHQATLRADGEHTATIRRRGIDE